MTASSRFCPVSISSPPASEGGKAVSYVIMALQAQQFPSNFSFPAESRGGAAIEEVLMVEELRLLLGVHDRDRDSVAVGLSDPRGELTCNGSGTRAKRPRDDGGQFLADASAEVAGFCSPYPLDAFVESAYPSTSGRPAETPLSQDLLSLLCQQNIEIDALLRLQAERMRSGLEAARKRHYRALIWGVEQRAAKRFREQEAELEKARRWNAELEVRVQQANTERQTWLTVAEQTEAVATSLRARLDQVLLQNAAFAQAKEGYGDTEEDDAQSTSPERYRAALPDTSRRCRSCRRQEASVLLLPCRHLCSCRDCEAEIATCPVCGSYKNASLHVSTSRK